MKKEVPLIAFLLSIPLVSAQYYSSQPVQGSGMITEGFNFLFGQTSNEIVLKLGLFILLVAVFKAGFAKMKLFEENPNMNMMLGAILSLIAIKFMPAEFSSGIGTFIWIAALFVLPYLLVSMFVKSTTWRIILSILGVGLIYYFISGGIGLYGSRYPYLGFIRGSEIFDDIYYKTTSMGWLIPVLLIAALIFLIYLMKKSGGGAGGSGGGLMAAWQARQDRLAKKNIAMQQRYGEEAAARAQETQAREERIKANKEAFQHRKAEEAKADADKYAAKQAGGGSWWQRYRQRKHDQEKEKQETERKRIEEENKRIIANGERELLAQEKEKNRLHELELEKIKQEKEQAKKTGRPRKYLLRRRLGGRQAKEGETPLREEKRPEPREERPEPKFRRPEVPTPVRSIQPKPGREHLEKNTEEDLNKLGQRRTGIIRRMRSFLGWKEADNPPAPLNVRKMGIMVPVKSEQEQEKAINDRGMEERMRQVRQQRYRSLLRQKIKDYRENEELNKLREEFGGQEEKQREAPPSQRITIRRTLKRVFKNEQEKEEARRRVEEYKAKTAKADHERKGPPPNPSSALRGRWREIKKK